MRRSFLLSSALITIVITTTLVTIACGENGSSSGAPELYKLVPATASVIGQIQVSGISSDVDFTSLYSDASKSADAPEDFAALLEPAKEET